MENIDIFKESPDLGSAFARLVKILRILRAPDGCPWDSVQTHVSLKRPMIEEAYEAVSAIDNGDMENLCEELGDVELQVIMHSLIAEEEGVFDLREVFEKESAKMIRRHPHVFAENVEKYTKEPVLNVDNVLDLWENVKQEEKNGESCLGSMRKIPQSLPALMRSEKIQAKAAKVGFDWDDVSGAFDKVAEESAELREAYSEGDGTKMKEELGDLLFAAVNVARFLGIDPEEALNAASAKFMDRFGYVESEAGRQGRKLTDMSLADMDKLWEEAKTLSK